MTNSTSNQDSCICVFAFPGPRKRTKQNKDEFIVEVSVSLAAVEKNPVRRRSPIIHQTSIKTLQHPRQAFLSATHGQQRDIIRNIIQGLETPFPLEDINWGLNFPADGTVRKLQNLDEIITDRLSGIARSCAENDQIGCIDIRISKLEKLENGKYQQLEKLENEKYQQRYGPVKQPLDDWILENQGKVDLIQRRCLCLINRFGRESPEDNKYYGLKSVKLGEEAEMESSVNCCSICIKGFEKNSQVIRMPCSHIFHGLCVFQWLQKSPTCPLCRYQLYGINHVGASAESLRNRSSA